MRLRTPTTPPRPDLGLPRTAPARSRRDATLLAVIAIGLVSLVAAGAVAIAEPSGSILDASPSPSRSAGPSATPTTGRVPTGPGGDYSFLQATFRDGVRVPVRWNPCQPIDYQLSVQAGPAGTRDAIEEALRRTTEATGIAFHDAGRARWDAQTLLDHRFFADAIEGTYRPVLITVVPHSVFRTFEVKKRVLAFALPERGTGPLDDQYVAGVVVVDGGVPYAQQGRWSLPLVVQHELGHLLGLGHVRATDELMFSFEEARRAIPEPIDGWGPGDLEGLRQLGAEQSCLREATVVG